MTAPGGNTNTGGNTSQAIASVAITGSVTTVAVGSSVTLAATALNASGSPVSASFSWSSNNTGVATVGASTGVVTGVSAGSATITAAAGGFSATRVMTVTADQGGGPAPLVAQITMPSTEFVPNAVTIRVGGTVTFVFSDLVHNVLFGGGAGAPQNIGNTSNSSVVRTFNTVGAYTITCTLHAGMTGTITVQQ